jgi:hypothetical protein
VEAAPAAGSRLPHAQLEKRRDTSLNCYALNCYALNAPNYGLTLD